MKFNQAFVATDNSVAIPHPLDEKTVFNLLPNGHADAWERLRNKYSLAKLDKLSKVYGDSELGELSSLAKHFDTMEEFLESVAAMAAAHVTNWTNLEDDDGPIAYSYEKCLELCLNNQPFLKWVDENCRALADIIAGETQAEEEVKKN